MANHWHDNCAKMLDASRKAVAWVNDPKNEQTIGVEKRAADKRIRRIVTEISKLDNSVDRPMCVGVFGPSQAGKSYLVSALASDGTKPLTVKFASIAEPVNFLQDINPGGNRESTGIVTRFSLRSVTSPDGFPVCLRLLTETDIIKILGNTYFLDGDPKKVLPLEREVVQGVLRQAEEISQARRDKPSDNRLSEEDIWDLQDYFERTFEGTRGIELLRVFWDSAAQSAPNLTIAERCRLFSVLWGMLEPFSAVYRELTEALRALSFSREAFCPIEALVPRSESIIDVQTLLSGLGQRGQPELTIRGTSGSILSLPRPILTALVAELHITMSEKPRAFFTHTDLLDFPGARSRQPIDFLEQFEKTESKGVADLFLRGKVAYLFERYVDEQELTSMLLCIKPSNQEVTTLPAMISDWIDKTHGSTPTARLNKSTVLFLVLTWFDTHFVDTAGEEKADPADRFTARLFSSIESFFAKSHSWPTNWTPGEPFRNVYWLRSPSYPAESIIVYDGDKRETGLRTDKQEYIGRLKEGYLRAPAVQRFFRDPAKAFDEGLRLNDGGITYLADNLAPVCRPDLKDEQIAGRLLELRQQLSATLAHYHVSNDAEARLEERRAVAGTILTHVQRLGQEQRFADLLADLHVSQHGFSDVIYDLKMRRSRAKPESGATSGATAGASPSAAMLPGMVALPGSVPLPGMIPLPGAAMPAAPSPAAAVATSARAGLPSVNLGLARAAIGHWIEVMRSNAGNDILGRYFLGDHKTALELVSELSNAARRIRLDQLVAATMDRIGGGIDEELDLTIEKAAFACSAVVNRFVTRFYFEAMPQDQRPTAPSVVGTMGPVFAGHVAANSAGDLPLEPSHQQYEAVSHWIYGFFRLVEENARSVDGLDIDFEQNARMGGILANISGVSVERQNGQ
jgi:hypothetical protein